MNLEIVIKALRERTQSTFGGRVAGAFEYTNLESQTNLQLPCAFVLPLDDNPGESQSLNTVRQRLEDAFSVVVCVSNQADERGQQGSYQLHLVRSVLWRALLGWRPTDDYDGIAYEGGQLTKLNRAGVWYRYDFSAAMEIGPQDGWQNIELANLGHFDGGRVMIDAIDPSDPNVSPTPAPDGRREGGFVFPKSGNLP